MTDKIHSSTGSAWFERFGDDAWERPLGMFFWFCVFLVLVYFYTGPHEPKNVWAIGFWVWAAFGFIRIGVPFFIAQMLPAAIVWLDTQHRIKGDPATMHGPHEKEYWDVESAKSRSEREKYVAGLARIKEEHELEKGQGQLGKPRGFEE